MYLRSERESIVRVASPLQPTSTLRRAVRACSIAAMDMLSIVVIFVGAGVGALVRAALGVLLNPLVPNLPLGTLAANLIGGLLMGIAMGLFAQYPGLSPAVRLAAVTGLLGGLTTFSTFSGETASLLLRGEFAWTATIVALHTMGSLLTTLAGYGAVRMLLR